MSSTRLLWPPLLLLFALAHAACLKTRVETRSQPRTLNLHFTDPCVAELVLEHVYEDGTFTPSEIADARATVEVPSLAGGYDERNGEKSNISDPNTADTIRISHRGQVALELSVAEVDRLPRDDTGAAIVTGACK